jgi:protein-disulfide isomerase
MTRRVDVVVTTTMVVAAIGLCGSYVYRSTWSDRTPALATSLRKADWSEAVKLGRAFSGDSGASTTMVIFTDLQCPVCRAVHRETLSPLANKYPHELRLLLVHYPLSYHPQALPAARATEYVVGERALRRWLDVVFEKQDSLSTKSMASFALDAGISDSARIAKCAAAEESSAAIDQGLALGRRLGIRGTPTILLNGRMLGSTPAMLQVDSVITAARRARP